MTDTSETPPKEATVEATKPGDQPLANNTPANIPRPTQLPAVVDEPAKQENAIKMLPIPMTKLRRVIALDPSGGSSACFCGNAIRKKERRGWFSL